jgi:hypothetical protein
LTALSHDAQIHTNVRSHCAMLIMSPFPKISFYSILPVTLWPWCLHSL